MGELVTICTIKAKNGQVITTVCEACHHPMLLHEMPYDNRAEMKGCLSCRIEAALEERETILSSTSINEVRVIHGLPPLTFDEEDTDE